MEPLETRSLFIDRVVSQLGAAKMSGPCVVVGATSLGDTSRHDLAARSGHREVKGFNAHLERHSFGAPGVHDLTARNARYRTHASCATAVGGEDGAAQWDGLLQRFAVALVGASDELCSGGYQGRAAVTGVLAVPGGGPLEVRHDGRPVGSVARIFRTPTVVLAVELDAPQAHRALGLWYQELAAAANCSLQAPVGPTGEVRSPATHLDVLEDL